MNPPGVATVAGTQSSLLFCRSYTVYNLRHLCVLSSVIGVLCRRQPWMGAAAGSSSMHDVFLRLALSALAATARAGGLYVNRSSYRTGAFTTRSNSSIVKKQS